MAKKQKASRAIVAGAGIGVLLIVIIPVLFFVFGVGNAEVLPQDTDPDPFEIPIDQIDTNDEIIDQIDDVICGGGGSEDTIINVDLAGEVIFDPTDDPCIPLGETPSPDEEVTPDEITDMVDELNDMVIDPPIINQTTSEDPPIVQTCDQNPDSPLCEIISPSTSIQLISKVTKTDSDGMTTITEEAFEITSLAFLVEEDTDRDFRTGFLNFELFLKGLPNTNYDGTGKVDLFVGEQSIFTEPTIIRVDSISDNEGMVQILFVSPTGTTSNELLFTFDDQFNKFTNEQVTPIIFNLVDLSVSDQTDDFSLVDQDLFTMDIARDDIKLIITDETGGTGRVYPTDSKIVIRTTTNVIYGEYCYIYAQLDGQPAIGSTKLGSPCLEESNTIRGTTVIAGTAPAPSVTGIILLSADGQLLLTKAGGTGLIFDELVTRNANYTLLISSPELTSNLIFGKSQETKSFTCIAEATPTFQIQWFTTGNVGNCGRGGCNYYILQSPSGISIGETTCNLPTESP